jgi:hypothetical protein
MSLKNSPNKKDLNSIADRESVEGEKPESVFKHYMQKLRISVDE